MLAELKKTGRAMTGSVAGAVGGLALITAMVIAAAFASTGAEPAAEAVPTSMAEIRLTFAPIVRETAPAVVNVYARRTVVTDFRSPFSNDPLFRRFFGEGFGGMPRERVENSLGSGVIVGSDGVVVTNHHVIQGGEELKVVLTDRREFDAELVLADERTDLAVLRIDPDGEALPALTFANSDEAAVGDLVLAIGNPFGVGQTVTSGIISALARTQVGVADYRFFIQTDAAINPGNSGGALVTADGRLIGINTAIYSRSGGSNGIGFAIPANMVNQVVQAALTEGRIVRPWLGAETQGVTADLAASLDLDRPTGVLVNALVADGPAARAGLQVGDLIVSVGGFEVHDTEALRYRLGLLSVGEEVTIGFLRRGAARTARLSLEAPPEDPPRNETLLEGRQPLSGARVVNLSPAVNEELGLSHSLRGVLIVDIESGSIARRYVRRGDIVVAVNGEEIDSVATLSESVRAPAPFWDLTIRRGGVLTRIQVRA